MTACPAALNGLRLRTSAGRRFAPGRSLNGNGTATTSQASQITERLVVLLARPLVHGLRERRVECRVEGFGTRNLHHVAFHLVADEVPGDGPQGLTDRFRQRDLALARDAAHASFGGLPRLGSCASHHPSVKGQKTRFKRFTAGRRAGGRGARPRCLPVSGLAEAGFPTNETVFSLTAVPPRLVVVGGFRVSARG